MQVPDKWYTKFENMDLEMRANDPDKENIIFTKAALAMCENIDWNVGRVVNKLEDLGIDDNTIVVYFNDNGPNSWRWNGGMKGRKGSTDEGGVRTPLFVKWPAQIEKGLIIIASNLQQLLPYIEISKAEKQKILNEPSAVTWLVKKSALTPKWIHGKHSKIAIRSDCCSNRSCICSCFINAECLSRCNYRSYIVYIGNIDGNCFNC